ncbi:bifunctional UDP-N-acetylglucosamine diphosphorylase/glucosamine-1-phosphate N-acetyltransferase GlmU [Lichenihabitans sp. PAMC28606]|nr:bifunctional UDP-N-acetylglucosamine diphosphorylase/glucosamine-1-phosphate N-acetyltransferase GlmU [Lichenihabitans sp. PAMC28606]
MREGVISQVGQTERRCIAVILAAGEGTRMKSAKPKALHGIAGRSMLSHVVAAAQAMGADHLAVVVAPGRDAVIQEIRAIAPDATIVLQHERRGTAHAVLSARDAIGVDFDDLVVLYADVPLIRPDTLGRLRAALADGSAVATLGFKAADPTGYGRLVQSVDGSLTAIREQKDATPGERAIDLCNSGLMALDGTIAVRLLSSIGCDNAQGEFYLTDVVEAAVAEGRHCAVTITDEAEVQGVNDRVQLAAAERSMQARLREAAMRGGATLVAPDTVFLSYDTVLGRDVVVEPQCWFGPGVSVGDGAAIHAFSYLEGATIASGASVGPYARLRPGAAIGENAKVGNFVEIKNAEIERGAKVSHLSYIGDATVGSGANIGAGTITCNYDGFNKARTIIGAGAFVGSNSALVAPVTIGEGAFIGSGSVITDDVAPDALAIGRGRQIAKAGWAETFRAEQKARKAKPRP